MREVPALHRIASLLGVFQKKGSPKLSRHQFCAPHYPGRQEHGGAEMPGAPSDRLVKEGFAQVHSRQVQLQEFQLWE